MTAKAPSRMTADIAGEYVVFLVGLHVNKFWRPDRWFASVLAGRAMDQSLRKDPASGMLSSRLAFTARGPMFVQIWRSFEDLERFSHAPDGVHQRAWKAFYKAVGRSGELGLWHETYLISPSRYEAAYVNMPRYGLAQAGEFVPMSRKGESARDRTSGAAEA